MDLWAIVVLVVLFVLLSIVIRRERGPVEHALDNTTDFAAKAELTSNMDRTRNAPPP